MAQGSTTLARWAERVETRGSIAQRARTLLPPDGEGVAATLSVRSLDSYAALVLLVCAPLVSTDRSGRPVSGHDHINLVRWKFGTFLRAEELSRTRHPAVLCGGPVVSSRFPGFFVVENGSSCPRYRAAAAAAASAGHTPTRNRTLDRSTSRETPCSRT